MTEHSEYMAECRIRYPDPIDELAELREIVRELAMVCLDGQGRPAMLSEAGKLRKLWERCQRWADGRVKGK